MIFNPISTSTFTLPKNFTSRKRASFRDKRLQRNWYDLRSVMTERQSVVINQVTTNKSEAASYYRFFQNNKTDVREMMHLYREETIRKLDHRHYLLIGDSTSLNLNNQISNIKDAEKVGYLEDDKTRGLKLHTQICVDAGTKNVIGFADNLIWSRAKSTAASKKQAPKLLWQQRENFKWLLSATNSKAFIDKSRLVTFVFDRQGDDFNVMKNIRELDKEKSHFLIRVKHDRSCCLLDEPTKIKQCLTESPIKGSYGLKLTKLDHYSSTKGKRVQRAPRETVLDVKYEKVIINSPSKDKISTSIPVSIVEIKEQAKYVPQGEPPVHWILITSHPVDSFEAAQEMVDFYKLRWIIEQLFRTLKSELKIEQTQLGSFDAITKQIAMAIPIACKTLQLVYARGKYEDSPPLKELFVDQEEIQVLHKLNEKYQGKTEKQQNPYPLDKMSWATWIIARLGGWKGYASQRKPGPKTIRRGLEKFMIHMEAFHMYNST